MAAVLQPSSFLVFYVDSVELATPSGGNITHCLRLLSLPALATAPVVSSDNSAFALLLHHPHATDLFYSTPTGVSHIQTPSTPALRLQEVFWLKDRLIGVDSSLFFYDFTHERELVELGERKESLAATEGEMEG